MTLRLLSTTSIILGKAFCEVLHTLAERPSARCLNLSGFICRSAAFRTEQSIVDFVADLTWAVCTHLDINLAARFSTTTAPTCSLITMEAGLSVWLHPCRTHRQSARLLVASLQEFICRGAAFHTEQRLLIGWQILTKAAETNSFKTTLAHGLNAQATIRSVSSWQGAFEIVFRRLTFF